MVVQRAGSLWLFLCESVNVCWYLSKQGGLERLLLDLVAQSRLESWKMIFTICSDALESAAAPVARRRSLSQPLAVPEITW